MLICSSRKLSYHNQCWKLLYCFIFLWKTMLHFVFQGPLLHRKLKNSIYCLLRNKWETQLWYMQQFFCSFMQYIYAKYVFSIAHHVWHHPYKQKFAQKCTKKINPSSQMWSLEREMEWKRWSGESWKGQKSQTTETSDSKTPLTPKSPVSNTVKQLYRQHFDV